MDMVHKRLRYKGMSALDTLNPFEDIARAARSVPCVLREDRPAFFSTLDNPYKWALAQRILTAR
ncbi:hypothetical protein MD484_g1059, partial [Candolleomyces efflorescens]